MLSSTEEQFSAMGKDSLRSTQALGLKSQQAAGHSKHLVYTGAFTDIMLQNVLGMHWASQIHDVAMNPTRSLQ